MTTMTLSQEYLLIGTSEACILVFELYKKGKEHLSQHISSVCCGPIVRSLSFSKSKKLILTNYRNSVLALNASNFPERAIECHGGSVTKVAYFDDLGLLVSSG